MNEMSDGCVGERDDSALPLPRELGGGECAPEVGPAMPPASESRSTHRAVSQLNSAIGPAMECMTGADKARAPLVFLSANISSPLDRPLLLAVGMVSLAGREFYAERKDRRLVLKSLPPKGPLAQQGNVRALRFLRADDVRGDQVAVEAGNWLSSLGAAIADVACLHAMSLRMVDLSRSSESRASTQLRLTMIKPVCRAGADFIGAFEEVCVANGDAALADVLAIDIRTIHGWKTSVPRYDSHLEIWLGPDHPLQRAKTLRMLYVTTGKRTVLRTLQMSVSLEAEGASRI